MVRTTPTPSPRLVKAAEAERQQLARHRRELMGVRESLRAELERIEGALEELAQRETLLDRLTGPTTPGSESDDHLARPAPGAVDDDASLTVLRGPAIRR